MNILTPTRSTSNQPSVNEVIPLVSQLFTPAASNKILRKVDIDSWRHYDGVLAFVSTI